MMRYITRAAVVASVIMISACSQPPAEVALRGQNTYGRNSHISNDGNRDNSSYAIYRESAKPDYKPYEPPPVYLNTKLEKTEQTAAVESIGVSDLPPPSRNKWTKKERVVEAQPEDEIAVKPQAARIQPQPQKPQPVAQAKPFSSQEKFTASSSASNNYMWPVGSHKVISNFGPKGAGKANDGINIASAEGEPVWAASDGEVIYSGNELPGYGNMVLIRHAGNKTTSYAHLSRATVDKYDRVKQGDIIGYVGATGNVKKPQLHFAIRDGKSPVDPRKYLSTSVAGL